MEVRHAGHVESAFCDEGITIEVSRRLVGGDCCSECCDDISAVACCVLSVNNITIDVLL